MKKQIEFISIEGTPRIGERCTLRLSNGNTVQTSRVIAISDEVIETHNSMYIKKRDVTNNNNSGELYAQPQYNQQQYNQLQQQYNQQPQYSQQP